MAGDARSIRQRRAVTAEILASNVQDAVDELGAGWYQVLVIAGIGSATLVESMEMGLVAPLHTALGHAYALSPAQRALLPLVTYLGAMLGMVVAGPVGDLLSRKSSLLASLVLSFVCFAAHAALPASVGMGTLAGLRAAGGFVGAMGVPIGVALAAESAPRDVRLRLVFAISVMSSVGYMLEAVGVSWFMPRFGEGDDDRWRSLCLFVGLPALVSVPLVMLLEESPAFLAARGDREGCRRALDRIAAWNGLPPPAEVRLTPRVIADVSAQPPADNMDVPNSTPAPTEGGKQNDPVEERKYLVPMLVLLTAMDATRSYFCSGSAYLCKDLFEMSRLGQWLSPTRLNIIASVSPLCGLILGERLVSLGVRRLMFAFSTCATAALMTLCSESVRLLPVLVLTSVWTFKLCYGPMGVCSALLKVEAFPATFRVTAIALISLASKLLCALGPTLVEVLKREELADSWDSKALNRFIMSLALAAQVSGLLALVAPRGCGDSTGHGQAEGQSCNA